MLPQLRSHDEYLSHVESYTSKPGFLVPLRHAHVEYKLRRLDLTGLGKIIAPLYSRRGRPSRNPEDLLRSLIAMALCGYSSIDVWVSVMRSFPYYAVISGFDPEDVPGVGTFFEFIDRISETKEKPKRLLSPKRYAKEEHRPHYGVLDRLAKRINRGYSFSSKTLEEIFYKLFVERSVELGLIDLESLYLAGDGTKILTYASLYPKKRCECKERCSCLRLYNDYQASLGYDSYHERWVYGYTIYELTAYSLNGSIELPVAILLGGAARHDSVLGLLALHQVTDVLNLPVKAASLDAGHDAMAIYRLGYERWKINLVIDLNEKNKGNFIYEPVKVTKEGIPICQAGYHMYYWGHCPDRKRLKWRCPLKATKHSSKRLSCSFSSTCSPSEYGRTFYTYPKSNYRLYTPIPRGSPLWEFHRQKRTAVERAHKRKKFDFGLLSTRTTGKRRWLFRAILAAICQHVEAWEKITSNNTVSTKAA